MKICEVCGVADGTAVVWGDGLRHCDLCAKKWLHVMAHYEGGYAKWRDDTRAWLRDPANRRQHEGQRQMIRTSGTSQTITVAGSCHAMCGRAATVHLEEWRNGNVIEMLHYCDVCARRAGLVGEKTKQAKQACRVNWHLTDKAAQEAYKGKTILCHLCEKPAMSQTPRTSMMNELLCPKHFDQWVEEDRDNPESKHESGTAWIESRKTVFTEWGVAPAPTLKDQIMDALKATRKDKDLIEEELSNTEYTQSCLKESSRQLDKKTEVLPRLRQNFVDASYAASRREDELTGLLMEIRKAAQRVLSEWPKCKHCNEDWGITELNLAGKTIGLGHTCVTAPEGEAKVKAREVKYEFSKELQRRMREYGIG